MKASELREKSADELHKQLVTELEKQFRLRIKRATGQLNETHEMKLIRHDIARIKTVLNENSGN